MKKIIVLIILGLVLAGCSAMYERRETLNDRMQGWVGSNESKLVSSWGAPFSSYQNRDGSRVLTWRSVTDVGGICSKTFAVDAKGIITGWKYNGCYRHTGRMGIPLGTPIPESTL